MGGAAKETPLRGFALFTRGDVDENLPSKKYLHKGAGGNPRPTRHPYEHISIIRSAQIMFRPHFQGAFNLQPWLRPKSL